MRRRRALSNATQNLMLYPLGGWGVTLVGLYFAGNAVLGLALLFPLALWLGGVVLLWSLRTYRRHAEGSIADEPFRAGVVEAAQLLSVAALSPAIVFMATDPLEPSAWATAGGVVLLGLATYHGARWITRIEHPAAYAAALLAAWLALPLNATGAVSIARGLGWFDQFVQATPWVGP
ncbi:MAG: hypothetical protein JXX28_08310 [Deltaproteobacteria bacterium]|nr:hypothetical protein [Deltaproteobacteria bacterium]